MTAITEGTTPKIELIGPDSVDFTQLGTCRVDIVQGDTRMEFTSPTVEAHKITVHLTQEQSLSLASVYPCKIQANFKNGSERVCTGVGTFHVDDNLHERVM